MVQKLLQHLTQDSPARERPLEMDEVRDVLLSAGPLELDPYRVFSDVDYGRNRVGLRDEFELAVICWKPGQTSNIHDHGRSLCAYLVVEGEMTEDIFESEDGDSVRKTGERSFVVGEVTVAEGRHIHRIRNASRTELVTVHLYTPPMAYSSRVYGTPDEG